MSHYSLRRWLSTLTFVAIASVGALGAQAILQTTTGISYVRDFTGTLSGGVYQAANGSDSAPAYSFGSDSDTGWKRAGSAGRVNFVSNGEVQNMFYGTGFMLRSDNVFGWDPSGGVGTDPDIALARGGTGILTFSSQNNTNNEDLDLDLETAANTATWSSSTGVDTVDFTIAGGATVGGFASGALHVTSPSASANSNAVITGHNSVSTNTQLWYLGSTSSSNNNVAFINRQNASISLNSNDTQRLLISSAGVITFPNSTVTSATLLGWADDETGTGLLTFATAPTFTTSIDIGAAGVRLSDDGDGAITFLGLGDGSDEDLTFNLDDTANRVSLSSSTGVVEFDFGTIVPFVEGSAGVDCTSAAAVTVVNGIVTVCS